MREVCSVWRRRGLYNEGTEEGMVRRLHPGPGRLLGRAERQSPHPAYTARQYTVWQPGWQLPPQQQLPTGSHEGAMAWRRASSPGGTRVAWSSRNSSSWSGRERRTRRNKNRNRNRISTRARTRRRRPPQCLAHSSPLYPQLPPRPAQPQQSRPPPPRRVSRRRSAPARSRCRPRRRSRSPPCRSHFRYPPSPPRLRRRAGGADRRFPFTHHPTTLLPARPRRPHMPGRVMMLEGPCSMTTRV